MAPHQYSSFTLIYHVNLAYNHCLEKECLHFRQLVRSVHSRIVNRNNVEAEPRRIHQILHILHEGHGIQAQIGIQCSFGVGFNHECGGLLVNESGSLRFADIRQSRPLGDCRRLLPVCSNASEHVQLAGARIMSEDSVKELTSNQPGNRVV